MGHGRSGGDSEDDDDETFVTLGTALELFGEDEVPKKPGTVQEQTVKDAQGRQRFHGAFTGGFSAGYFNTVGTKEGWAPSSFVSSRSKEAGSTHAPQRPEDFMDDEDLGEHGIAPRHISTTADFRSSATEQRKRKQASDVGGVIPGPLLLQDLVVAAHLPIGIRLLRKLGWKEGQGIGPRVRRKRRKRHPRNEEGKKVYGCQMPPEVGGSEDSAGGSEEDDLNLGNVTFAPKDMTPFSFTPKDNYHGLGYSGINPGAALGHMNLFEGHISFSGRKGMSGHAFGVGALNEDDEDADIYAMDHLSNYDRVLEGPNKHDTHGWTEPKGKDGQGKGGDADRVLPGFKLASTPLKPRQVYPPPVLPRDFRAIHVPHENRDQTSPPETEKGNKTGKKLNASARGALLGEVPQIKSVFELMSKSDQRMVEMTKTESERQQTRQRKCTEVEEKKAGVPVNAQTQPRDSVVMHTQKLDAGIPSDTQKSPECGATQGIPKQRSVQPLFTGTTNFKPFARDPDKQARYEEFLEARKQGQQYAGEAEDGQMTEWERAHELEEFARAAMLYRPLSSMMASRFTAAKYDDEDAKNAESKTEKDANKSDQAKAAEMKMYGKLTREALEWHPDRVLCKRFNVPDPYPESTIVGLRTAKRDKYSVFTFLNAPTQSDPGKDHQVRAEVQELSPQPERKKAFAVSKPLAILAKVDLSQLNHPSQQPTAPEGQSENPEMKMSTQAEQATDKSLEASDISVDIPMEDGERPPVDLFKAIFEDTASEQSSSEAEMEVDSSSATALMGVPEDKQQNSPIVSKTSAENIDVKGGTSPEPMHAGQDTESSAIMMRESAESRLAPDSAREEPSQDCGDTELGTYGPALPPSLVVSSSDEDGSRSRGSISKKHKKKEKKKKKKAKHKKHKHKEMGKKKKKKKHKKEVIDVSSTSPDSDVESSSDSEDGTTDVQLLQRLKSLPPGHRPSAADFM